MRVLMIGPPGAGKGTQGALIAAHFHLPHVVIGELLRDHVARGTDLGRAVKGHLDRGELVPDEIVLDLTRRSLIAAKAAGGGYVIDGAPRTFAQARAAYLIACELGMTAHVALNLQADDDELVRRMRARAAFEHRSDDTEEVIRRRLALYHRVTQPILRWYTRRGILLSIEATRPIEEVGREILAALQVMRPPVEHIPDKPRRPVDLTRPGAGLGSEPGASTTAAPATPRPDPRSTAA